MTSTDTRYLDDALKATIRSTFEKLRGNMPGFRNRKSQNRMIASVSRALGTPGGRGVSEAATGVGKSMAYLVAGVPIALAHDRKLVISTGTVALQQQIAHRDLPAFLKATGIQAKVVLVKGRQRFACVLKTVELGGNYAGNQDELDGMGPAGWTRPPKPEEVSAVEVLSKALLSGKWDGDMDNPPVAISDALKPMMTTTAGGCTGRGCAFFNECPAKLAREEAKTADILVANHDLVMLSLRQAAESTDDSPNFLSEPSETIYVLDEGHSIGKVAIGANAHAVHMPSAVSRTSKLRKLCAGVYRFTGKDRVHGVTLEKLVGSLGDLADNLKTTNEVISLEWQPKPGESMPTWRAPLGVIPDGWRQFANACRLSTFLVWEWLLMAGVEVRAAEGKKEDKDRLLRSLGLVAEQFGADLQLWKRWSELDDGGAPAARWVSLGSDQGLVVHASDISGAEFLTQTLWAEADSVLLTSATLSSNGDFSFLAEEIGAPAKTEYVSLPSPFDLQNQAVLSVPAFPVLPDDQRHPEEVANWLVSQLDWDAGSMVIFTSKRKMELVASMLPAALRAKTLMQGEVTKQQLIDRHCAAINSGKGSVILCMLSLGEGADFPGKLVTTVVITQTPFTPPTDPISATRNEWLESEGRNPFIEISVPEALRTLTQFAGRLIRHETDEGRIVILDRRLTQRRYGKTILDGLPDFRRDIVR